MSAEADEKNQVKSENNEYGVNKSDNSLIKWNIWIFVSYFIWFIEIKRKMVCNTSLEFSKPNRNPIVWIRRNKTKRAR